MGAPRPNLAGWGLRGRSSPAREATNEGATAWAEERPVPQETNRNGGERSAPNRGDVAGGSPGKKK
jgi:hypothetical protein